MTTDTRTAAELATAAEAAALDAHDAAARAQPYWNANRHEYARAVHHAADAWRAHGHAADSADRGGPLAAPAARSWARLARLHATAAEHAASEVEAAAGGDPSLADILASCEFHRDDAAAQLVHTADAARAGNADAAERYADRAAEAAELAAGCVDHVHPTDADRAAELADRAREIALQARALAELVAD